MHRWSEQGMSNEQRASDSEARSEERGVREKVECGSRLNCERIDRSERIERSEWNNVLHGGATDVSSPADSDVVKGALSNSSRSPSSLHQGGVRRASRRAFLPDRAKDR